VLRPWCFALDIHFRPRNARLWCGRSGLDFPVFPVLGTGQSQSSLVRTHLNKHYGLRTLSVATEAATDILFARLKISEPGPRYCHFPRTYDSEFYAQLTCESVMTRYVRGFPKRVYHKASGARNEALDVRVYQLAALDIRPPNLKAIADGQTPGAAAKQEPKPVQRNSWMGGVPRAGWL
jgi:phage terminase large subunit GpA-like protein